MVQKLRCSTISYTEYDKWINDLNIKNALKLISIHLNTIKLCWSVKYVE